MTGGQCDDMSESGCGEHNHMVNDWLTVSDHMSESGCGEHYHDVNDWWTVWSHV